MSLSQGRWFDDSSLLMLPHFTEAAAAELEAAGLGRLPLLLEALQGSGGGGGSGGSRGGSSAGGGRAASASRQRAVDALERALGEVSTPSAGVAAVTCVPHASPQLYLLRACVTSALFLDLVRCPTVLQCCSVAEGCKGCSGGR